MNKRFARILVIVACLVVGPSAAHAQSPALIAEEISKVLAGSKVTETTLGTLLANDAIAGFVRGADKASLVQLTMALGRTEGMATGGRVVLGLAQATENPSTQALLEMCEHAGSACPVKSIASSIDAAAAEAAGSGAGLAEVTGKPLQNVSVGGRRGRPRVYATSISTNYDYLQEAVLDQRNYPAMNIKKMEGNDWIRIDEQFAEQMEMKRRLYELRRDKVFYVAPKYRQQAREGGRELLDMLAEYLPGRYPQYWSREGDFLLNRVTGERFNVVSSREHPLAIAGRLTQEDLTLVWTSPEGEHYLIAGSVAFPSGWILQNFAGLKVSEVHSAVPNFERIARGVDRVLTNLRAEQPLVRNNVLFYQDPTLPQPGDRVSTYPVEDVVRGRDVAENLYLRSERETLRRLPDSGMIVFTIREHVYPMSVLEQFPDVASRLSTGVRNMANDVPDDFAKPVLEYLDGITADAPAGGPLKQ